MTELPTNEVAAPEEEIETLDQIKARISNRIDQSQTYRTSGMSGQVFGSVDAATSTQMEANSEGVMQSLNRSVRLVNAAAGLYNDTKARHGFKFDPNFRISDHWKDLELDSVPMEYWDNFNDVESMEEAMYVKTQINREIEDLKVLGAQGVQGMGAILAAGLFDIDSVIAFGAGGLGAAAKMTRLAKMAQAATNAGIAGAGVEAINASVRPTYTIQDVVVAGLYGTALGGVAGMFGKPKYKSVLENAADEASGPLSVGAMQNPNAKIYAQLNPANYESPDDLVAAAKNWGRSSAFSYKLGRGNSYADQFERILGNSPLRTDYDRMARSPSSVANWFAYEGLESAAGKVRNNRTMANQREVYHKQISSLAIPEYSRAFADYSQGQGVNLLQRTWDGSHADNFGKQVMNELFNRRYDTLQDAAKLDPAVKRAADAIEAAGQRAFEIARGVGDEIPIKGFEDIKYKRGYFPLIWRGDKLRKMYGLHGEKKVQGVLGRAYAKSLGVDEATGITIAKAVARRAIAKEDGFDTNVQNMLSADGREFLKQALVDNGLAEEKAQALLNSLGSKLDERGKANFAKGRIEVDLRYNEDGISLMDMIETDLMRSFSKYSRELSGKAAMARKGIASRTEWSRIKDAIRKEDPTMDDDFLEGIHSYFGGGPLAGGVNPHVRRAMQLTNVSLLNGLGLTQVAETGPIIAASGWEAFIKTAPDIVKDALGKPTSSAAARVVDEFRPFLGNIGDEHIIFRDDYALDMHRGFTGEESKLMQTVDHALAQGQRVQGYMSGFYNMRQIQQRIAVSSMSNKVMKAIRDNDAEFMARMDDIGMSDELQAYISSKLKDGTVKFAPDGSLDRMGLGDWNPMMAEEFSLAMNRHTDQVVQRAMAGESSVWMHRDVGSIFMHLKTFPVLAMQKQFIRNARLMDTAAAMTFMYGLATAGIVYTVKEIIANRPETNLSPIDVAKGAFALSNMTGWMPMWSDPLAAMFGLDSLKFSDYGPRGVTDGIIATPPALPTLNRMLHLPGAVLDMLDGDVENSSAYAMQAIPIIGNHYAFNWIFNSMKE